MKNVIKLSEQELKTGNKTSWHDQYKNSAWIFCGGLPYDLSEGLLLPNSITYSFNIEFHGCY